MFGIGNMNTWKKEEGKEQNPKVLRDIDIREPFERVVAQ